MKRSSLAQSLPQPAAKPPDSKPHDAEPQDWRAGVAPLGPSDRVQLARPAPPPTPRQRLADERAALHASWSDGLDELDLLLSDESLSFAREGLSPDVLRKLRRGHWSIQATLDLHGLRRDSAREALLGFLLEAERKGWRCVRVVHGKGHGSKDGVPVLKQLARRWLMQSRAVLAFVQARAPDGGAGALVVLLR